MNPRLLSSPERLAASHVVHTKWKGVLQFESKNGPPQAILARITDSVEPESRRRRPSLAESTESLARFKLPAGQHCGPGGTVNETALH